MDAPVMLVLVKPTRSLSGSSCTRVVPDRRNTPLGQTCTCTVTGLAVGRLRTGC